MIKGAAMYTITWVRSLGDLIAAAVLPDAAHARALGVAEAPRICMASEATCTEASGT